jgi:hypothetical protein
MPQKDPNRKNKDTNPRYKFKKVDGKLVPKDAPPAEPEPEPEPVAED